MRSWGSWQLLFDRRPAAWGFPCAFALCNGPLLAAVLAWRNSFVFHNLDKVTSTALHGAPNDSSEVAQKAGPAAAQPAGSESEAVAFAALAVKLGATRLIDNVLLD